MNIRNIRLPIFLSLSLFCVNTARADYLSWTYSTTPSVPGFSAGGSGSSGGVVALTDYTNQAGGTSIPVIAYTTSSSSTSPVTFNSASSVYTMTLSITDNSTHDTGTLTFTGSVGGTLSATTSTLTNSFVPSPNTLTLDGHTYTVTIPSAALAPPTSKQQNILATVSVSDATGGGTPTPPTANTPEPSSIILACAGMVFLGAGGVRRLRSRLAMA